MKKIKNNILWILCGLNYISYLGIFMGFGTDTPNTSVNHILFYGGMWSMLYATFVSSVVTVIGIAILIIKLIKNKRLSVNHWILLALLIIGILPLIFLGFCWWFGIG